MVFTVETQHGACCRGVETLTDIDGEVKQEDGIVLLLENSEEKVLTCLRPMCFSTFSETKSTSS